MDFEFSDEQRMLKESAREVMEKEIIPHADEWDKKILLNDKKYLKGVLDKIIPLGYIGATLPMELGGCGLDNVSWGILFEELGRAYGSLTGIVALIDAVVRHIAVLGTPEQKDKYLPSLLTGERIPCMCLSEPNVGSDVSGIETSATPDGDYYVINGTKLWITNGAIADVAIVNAQTKKGSGPSGLCQLIVEKEVSPYETRELTLMSGRGAPPAELVFADCRVPKENLLVPTGGGMKAALKNLIGGRASIASASVGTAQAAIDASIHYVKERRQFGKPIGAFQLIQEMITDMVVGTDASRLLTFRAHSLLDQGVMCEKEASMAKLYATENAVKVTSMAIQIHGAIGLSEEMPLERFFRDARGSTIPDGTTQIQKLIVARHILGLSAFR